MSRPTIRRHHRLVVLPAILCAALMGCSKEPTPPEVTAELEDLLEKADTERPGATVERLKDFRLIYQQYDVVDRVDDEIDRLRDLVKGRYHEAREIAREGDFDRAEAILLDLSAHFPETQDGRSAEDHLAYDFYRGKAQWLMAHQRWEDAGKAVEPLVDRDLTPSQRKEVESILDSAQFAGTTRRQATLTQLRVASMHIVRYLSQTYAELGRYPSQLTRSDVEEWDPMGSRSELRELSSIESYLATEQGYEFTAVGAQGQSIHVVDGVIEE